jgi:hypothetical protein
MKFLEHILRRKAAPMAPIELVKPTSVLDSLPELQDSIAMRQSRLAAMQAEAAEMGAQLGEVSTLSSMLKVRLSEGDVEAGAQLDALEREQQGISRRQDGLRLRIISLQSELAPLVRQASELACQLDQSRQDHLVNEAAKRTDELIEEILSNWTRSCEAAFELMTLLDGRMAGEVRLDDEHRREIFALNTVVGERLQKAALVHVNQQAAFQFARSEVFRRLRIIPAKRKETTRAAG